MKRPYMVGVLTEENKPLFDGVEKSLQYAGLVPLNPMVHTYGPEDTWLDMMRDVLRDLSVATGIVTVGGDGTETMEGRIVCRLARDIGLPVANVEWWVETKGEVG